jgi:cell division septation protein DedD
MRPDVSPDFHDLKYYKYRYATKEEGKTLVYAGRKNIFSIFKRKTSHPEQTGQPGTHASDLKIPQEKAPRISGSKIFFILVAFFFLTIGILWQNGVISLINWPPEHQGEEGKAPIEKAVEKGPTKKDEIKPDQKLKEMPVQTTPQAIPEKPAGEVKSPDVQTSVAQSEEGGPQTARSPDQFPSYPYALYLGSFGSLDEAKRAENIYRQKGLSPYLAKVDFKEKGIWFRVFIGHFKDEKEALRFKQEKGLAEAGLSKTQFANIIGTFSTGETLDQKMLSLEKLLGYSPYLIEEQDGRARLFVGAYLTREGAESLYKELESNGIQNQVVMR